MVKEVKASKIVVSIEKGEEWLKRIRENFAEMYNKLSGKLLTTLELALPEGHRLEAAKSRVKGVQGEAWDKLADSQYELFYCCFSIVEDAKKRPEVTPEEFRTEVDEFWASLESMIRGQLELLKRTVVNLAELATDDTQKQMALKKEMGRLVYQASDSLRRWIYRAVEGALLEIK